MGDKGRGCRKEADPSTPVVVELITTPEAGSDARLRRAMEMVLAAAARQSQQMGTPADGDDDGDDDASPPPQHPTGRPDEGVEP